MTYNRGTAEADSMAQSSEVNPDSEAVARVGKMEKGIVRRLWDECFAPAPISPNENAAVSPQIYDGIVEDGGGSEEICTVLLPTREYPHF